MQFDHVIQVHEDGSITEPEGIWAPDVLVCADGDGSILEEHENVMLETLRESGWDLLSGFTSQFLYFGPIMHQSEFIGGALEAHIRETPGYYTAVVVYTDEDSDDNIAGWAVAYREDAI